MSFAFRLNQRGEFIFCAPNTERLFGMNSRRLLNSRLDEFVTWESGSVLLQALLDVYNGNNVEKISLNIIANNRHNFHVSISLKPLMSDQDLSVIGVDGKFEKT